MTKPLVIYHADCTDGFGAAFAAYMALGDGAEYVPMHYNTIKEPANLIGMFGDTFAERDVYILDFSLPKEAMDWLFANAKRVVWLDHHATAFEMWCGKYESGMRYEEGIGSTSASRTVYIHLDDNKSGALLAWEYFHPGTEVPLLIQHIDDRDRWQFKLEGSKELHAALRSRPFSFDAWERIYFEPGYEQNALDYSYREGAAILRAQDQNVQSMAKQARECAINLSDQGGTWRMDSPVGLAVNAPIHQSEVGHELANASGTYGLVYYIGDDNAVRCSLRSDGEYDVSAIARSFGGGGHRNAAGFETDVETLMSWLT